MKVFAAALPFLILAAALGAPTQASVLHGSPPGEHGLEIHSPDRFIKPHSGVHRPPNHYCCPSYIPRNIRCAFMEDYYETSSECPLPGVIFITRRGQQVCVDPHSRSAQRCMEKLDSANTGKTAD